MQRYYGFYKAILMVVICLCVLVSCQQNKNPVSKATSTLTTLSKPTITHRILSPTPTVKYQLTYLSDCEEDYQCMYAVDTSCLEGQQPCLGNPQLLFKIPKTGDGPRLPAGYNSWSPDGQQVAIEAVGSQGKNDIFLGDWAGQKWINLTNSPTYQGEPSWSPDGRRIAYFSNTGKPDYFVRAFWINPAGKNSERLLQSLDASFADTQGISWSPDEKRIVFTHSDNQGHSQIYIANPDGSNLKQLTNQGEDHLHPRFSPDGQGILFTRIADPLTNSGNLYLIRPNGTDERAVTKGSLAELVGASWSPIGNWIAYSSKLEDSYDIYLTRSDGTGLTRATQSNADETFPAWRVILP